MEFKKIIYYVKLVVLVLLTIFQSWIIIHSILTNPEISSSADCKEYGYSTVHDEFVHYDYGEEE